MNVKFIQSLLLENKPINLPKTFSEKINLPVINILMSYNTKSTNHNN